MLNRVSLLSIAIVLCGVGLVAAQNPPPAYTVIQVQEMHCDGCAKRIGGKLQKVSGVANIQYDVAKKTVWIHPQPGAALSPKMLWEAVEQANDRPTILQGPSGTFTAKPKS